MADEITLDNLGGFAEAAARTRRRYPVREPDPLSLAASQGGVPWSAFLPSDERARASAASLQAGGDYDPRDVLLSALGLVGAPAVGPAEAGLATLGAGLIRRPPLVAGEPVGLGAFPTTTPRRILQKTKEGGYSVRLPTGELPTEGYMAGIYRNEDPRNLVVEGRAPTLADIGAHAETNLAALQKPERHFGTWLDPETGTTYLDVSQRFAPGEIRPATKFGERTAQKSIYDISAGTTRPVGSWADFIQTPEFHARMNEMATGGREYLSQFPTKEWWDMHGGPFERAYGTANMPQTAGFTASTAPNTAPIQNLQQMSEYMRRHIRGEPIIQPEWRAPEDLMSLAPGRQLPLEQSRVANLQKAARGDIEALRLDKVRNEAQAMMGDPNAVVLDRHWARVAEKPSEGIYTGSQEGVISADPRKSRPSDYGLLKDQVTIAANAAGRPPRDFSADAWTGIRNTIQKTGQLFGEKFRGAAISGESKSYADHFEDLIRTKAQHMGMTAQELEKRLRGGDASLLGVMLGAPTIGAAYRYWSADQGHNGSASSAENRASAPAL